jgi:hypothetical protein
MELELRGGAYDDYVSRMTPPDVYVTWGLHPRSGDYGANVEAGRIWSPYPSDSPTFALYAHEISHFATYDECRSEPDWREELECWRWALKLLATHHQCEGRCEGCREARVLAARNLGTYVDRAWRSGETRRADRVLPETQPYRNGTPSPWNEQGVLVLPSPRF